MITQGMIYQIGKCELRVIILSAILFFIFCSFCSMAHAQIDDDYQAYVQAANSVLTALGQNDTTGVQNGLPSLIDAEENLSRELEVALHKVQAAVTTGDPYAGTDSNLSNTTYLVNFSALHRQLAIDYANLWLQAVDSQDGVEETKQIALDGFSDALSFSEQAVSDITPLMEYVNSLSSLPPVLLVDVPREVSFASIDDVRLRVVIRNEGDEPAQNVLVSLQSTSESGEVTTQKATLETIGGKSQIAHTFNIQVPADTTSMTVSVSVSALNSSGDFAVTTLNFASP